jgi:hypothetical protein
MLAFKKGNLEKEGNTRQQHTSEEEENKARGRIHFGCVISTRLNHDAPSGW